VSYDFTDDDLDMMVLRMLFEQFAFMAGLQYAYDLGDRSVALRAQRIDANYYWTPGNYIPANEERIACCWCHVGYRVIAPGQGHYCAASAFREDSRWFVQGHYGSGRHDTNVYLVNKNEGLFESQDNPGQGLDPICDRCLDKMVEDGTLTIYETGVL